MSQILDGKIVRDQIRERLKQEIATFIEQPKLVIIQVGDLEESSVFIRQKKLFAEAINALIEIVHFKESTTEEDILQKIEKLNRDGHVHGIIIQMPLPTHISSLKTVEAIDPLKDVDGLHSKNLKLQWERKTSGYMAATARGVLSLLDFYKIPIAGKRVVIVGRSSLVGRSVALALLNRDATVTITHTKTKDLIEETKRAEILVVATGHKHLITREFVSSRQVIIDIGITSIEKDGKKILVGDVDFEHVEDIVSAITPVPGGVGPLTVASLFENLVDAYRKAI